jgi:hypothetical protein
MYSSKGIHGILLTLIGLSLLLFPAAATATPILAAPIYVKTTGEVKATFLGQTAAYSDDLYLDSPTNALGIIFNNHSVPIGTEVSLGTFTAGTELILRIHVNNTGDDFFSGPGSPGSLNPDGVGHAKVDDTFALDTSYVGFEDLLNGGDKDYDDLKISLSNTSTSQVPPGAAPLPATFLLVSTGMGMMALLKRKRKDLV